MDYQQKYDQLIEKAKQRPRPTGYKHGKPKTQEEYNVLYELSEQYGLKDMITHHILPKCMGGTNDKDNLVYLTHKEHKLAHKLLYYIHKFDNYKLPLMYSYMMLYNYDKPYIITELRKRPVVALDPYTLKLKHTFNSIKEAEIFVKRKCVNESLANRVITVGGYKWLYLEQYKNPEYMKQFKSKYKPPMKNGEIQRKPIVQILYENNKLKIIDTYESLADAQRKTGVSSGGIVNVCKGNIAHANKHLFMYKDTYVNLDARNNFLKNLKELRIKKLSMNGKTLIAFNKEYTEIIGIYLCQRLAGEALNIKYYNDITNVCSGKHKSINGYGFIHEDKFNDFLSNITDNNLKNKLLKQYNKFKKKYIIN